MAEKIILKDILCSEEKVRRIAEDIQSVYPSFAKEVFAQEVLASFKTLELKARISSIAKHLWRHLGEDYESGIDILLSSLPEANDPSLTDNDFGDFIYASYAEYVAEYGCSEQYLQKSFSALYQITQRFSAEYAMRVFINRFPNETLQIVSLWAVDPNYHVRRLCSECTRPKLPWGQKIHISEQAPLPILEKLFSDKTRFVTRSVANHINDISKIDETLAIDTISDWRLSAKQTQEEMDFITRHALRTLVKRGDEKALSLLGFEGGGIEMISCICGESALMNTAVRLSCTVQATKDIDLLIEYILYSPNKGGALAGKKVFRIKRLYLRKGETYTFTKDHVFREGMTTRKYYKGKHEIELQINGRLYGRHSVLLY